MSLAMSLIVDGYVRLGDRAALETLRVHRLAMLDSARSVAELDVTRMVAALKEEIELIDAGLLRLDAQREQTSSAPDRGPAMPPQGDGSSA